MTRRSEPLHLEDRVRTTVRQAFQPLYDEPLTDNDVGEITDNLRRFYTILAEMDAEDRIKATAAGAKP